MRTLRLVSLPLLVALALTGCFDQPDKSEFTPTDPAAMLQTKSAASGFIPMTPGNHWTYDWELTTQVVPDDGAPDPPVTERGTIDIVHVEYRSLGEREYILEREKYSVASDARERLRRQDRAGYYIFERDKNDGKSSGRPVLSSALHNTAEKVAARSGTDLASVEAHLARVDAVRRMLRGLDSTHDASPPGGPHQDELQQLAYPLHVGATWVIRGSPLFAATVEGREQFRGFSAWRIRIDGAFIDADDYVHTWYSRCGEVGRRFHFESPATAPDGTPLGRFVSDEYVDIIALDVDRGGCDVVPGGGGGTGKGLSSYPIAVGNRWVYELTTTTQSRNDPPVVTTSTVVDVQEAWEQIMGREYMRQVTRTLGVTPAFTEQYVRQDRDGLFQLQTIPTEPGRKGLMPMLSRLPEADELTILNYPLKVGSSWTIIDFGDESVTATVEARERVSTPTGEFDSFRVAIRNPFQSDGDKAFVWYSRDGVVKSYILANLGDDSWVEEVWELQELDLAK